MTSILWVTGLASLMMFTFFFVLPALDRGRVRKTADTSSTVSAVSRSPKPAY